MTPKLVRYYLKVSSLVLLFLMGFVGVMGMIDVLKLSPNDMTGKPETPNFSPSIKKHCKVQPQLPLCVKLGSLSMDNG
ncbi:hypothetical protein PCC7424_3246 [Gloeothece citriformis PCC 7424]|uniref:Uncharacterized protein n=1 Tax=Gloeothece citriformis (strain PCC 7424) TaxID=65393 RepID=B7KCU5_GLOC7|nr:hypothetical protein [Gloeothece citriformis]ACK71646.1 hypothetical protein PCC7424_3246 [Gloeothece citriformis PCC 7424]